MKKRILIGVLFVLALMLNSICFASSNVTYFYGEGIDISDKNIEILSYEININQETSEVKNTILLNNNDSKDKVITIQFPLENPKISTTIKDLKILVDDVEVEYIKNEEGKYLIATKIMGNTGKKIEVNYKTENDLNKAKIIKYNLENLKERKVGKVKFEYKLPERDIPLVDGIYPRTLEV